MNPSSAQAEAPLPIAPFFRQRTATARFRARLRGGLPLLLLVLLLAISGCASRVQLLPVDPAKRTLELSRNVLDSGKVSESTLLFLEERALFGRWKKDPVPVLTELFVASSRWQDAEEFLTLTELCFYQAAREQKPELSARLYLTTALLAYQALFHAPCAFPRGPYEPGSYIASQYYNRALAKYVIAFRDAGKTMTHETELPLLAGSVEVRGRTSDFSWPPQEVERYLISSEFKLKGLRREGTDTGLGAALVFKLKHPGGAPAQSVAMDPTAIKETNVRSSTLVFGFSPCLEEGDEPRYTATVAFYDPLTSTEHQDGERSAPLASDFSTAIAFGLSQAPDMNPLKALLAPEEWTQLQGLILMQPYQKGKIPVVFVHGLMSSPLTWAGMFNRLMNDPTLRQRYQFWFFGYATSNPVGYSEYLLRKVLLEARQRFDPERKAPEFDRLVVVGHSMGGLLARGTTLHGDLETFRRITNLNPDLDGMDPEARDFIEKMLVYEPVPFVSRVVFLATPHRGASMAEGTIGRIGSALISLPLQILKVSASLLTSLTQHKGAKAVVIGGRTFESMPTGIDSLLPSNPILSWQAGQMEASTIPFHSIIGNNRQAGIPGGEDGVVPYESAHLANAQSELVVLSGHSVQEQPPTVAEVRRILVEHIGEARCP